MADGQEGTREDIGANLRFWIYDEYNNTTFIAYYVFGDGEYHLVVPTGQEHAGIRYSYDENGRWSERIYVDAQGNPVMNLEEGNAIYRRKYNDMGQLIAEMYYDENGEFVNNVHGYAMIEYIYDESGSIVDSETFDQSEAMERLGDL